jgi:RNA 3'-phosphate cyclase
LEIIYSENRIIVFGIEVLEMTGDKIIQINGSYGEGGGQILRTSIALSALTGEAVSIKGIRENRPKPGLAPQHLRGIMAVKELTNAQVDGAKIGSTSLRFIPTTIRPGGYNVNIGTAGSITLILQAFNLPAAFTAHPVSITISGGTDVKWSPPIDYMKKVFLKILDRMGYRGNINIIKRGYYPKGGGAVCAEIMPAERLGHIQLSKRGRFKRIVGISYSMNLPSHVVERQKKAAEDVLKDYETCIKTECLSGISTDCGIVLWAEFEDTVLGSSSLGRLGKPAENVGSEAALGLLREIKANATVDAYMADQLIPYMALAESSSSIVVSDLTGHLKTNIYTTERFLGNRFEVSPKGDNYVVFNRGVGYKNKFI